MTLTPPRDHDPAAAHEATQERLRRAIRASHARHNPNHVKLDPEISEADLPAAPPASGEARHRARWAWLLHSSGTVKTPFG